MSNLTQLLAQGEATIEETNYTKKSIENMELANNGIEACKKTLLFPLGVEEIHCYDFTNPQNQYCSWGICSYNGTFTCYTNLSGKSQILGKCNLLSFKSVFHSLQDAKLKNDLKRFLERQIEKASNLT